MTTITAVNGDTADLICRRVYGDESGYVEAILLANPGLAAHGPLIPEGTVVTLPVVDTAADTAPVVSLWE